MRFSFLAIIVAVFAMAGCKKDRASSSSLSGDYTGTFVHSTIAGRYMTAHVTVHLGKNDFSGSSDMVNYPAICRGTWEVSGNALQFNDQCIWPANFDWTLILTGSYEYHFDGKHLSLSNNIPDNTNQYELDKVN